MTLRLRVLLGLAAFLLIPSLAGSALAQAGALTQLAGTDARLVQVRQHRCRKGQDSGNRKREGEGQGEGQNKSRDKGEAQAGSREGLYQWQARPCQGKRYAYHGKKKDGCKEDRAYASRGNCTRSIPGETSS